MSSLKDQLIKLGKKRPDLRPHIRPVLATLSKLPWGDIPPELAEEAAKVASLEMSKRAHGLSIGDLDPALARVESYAKQQEDRQLLTQVADIRKKHRARLKEMQNDAKTLNRIYRDLQG